MTLSTATSFEGWLAGRELQSIGTNHGSKSVAFQDWQKFKEAFAPELVARAVDESEREVQTVLDPFGGSGTTALSAQFLGLDSVTIEVNPYLADLIEAKLVEYDLYSLRSDIEELIRALANVGSLVDSAQGDYGLPATFVEPGVNSRWIFSRRVIATIAAALDLIEKIDDPNNRRLARVAIGGTLVGLSNVRVSGKGRRYRSGWAKSEASTEKCVARFSTALRAALSDVESHHLRETHSYTLLRGDCREALGSVRYIDLAVFSPPYPNSFDYTDVYNVELWVLGYLQSSGQNRELRKSTLASHVQIRREFEGPPAGSSYLDEAIGELVRKRNTLWDRHIPEMVGGYFADMTAVLASIHATLRDRGEVWMVVGDSRYSGVDIRVAEILVELAPLFGFDAISQEPFRSMRSSPQQGGALALAESLVILRKK